MLAFAPTLLLCIFWALGVHAFYSQGSSSVNSLDRRALDTLDESPRRPPRRRRVKADNPQSRFLARLQQSQDVARRIFGKAGGQTPGQVPSSRSTRTKTNPVALRLKSTTVKSHGTASSGSRILAGSPFNTLLFPSSSRAKFDPAEQSNNPSDSKARLKNLDRLRSRGKGTTKATSAPEKLDIFREPTEAEMRELKEAKVPREVPPEKDFREAVKVALLNRAKRTALAGAIEERTSRWKAQQEICEAHGHNWKCPQNQDLEAKQLAAARLQYMRWRANRDHDVLRGRDQVNLKPWDAGGFGVHSRLSRPYKSRPTASGRQASVPDASSLQRMSQPPPILTKLSHMQPAVEIEPQRSLDDHSPLAVGPHYTGWPKPSTLQEAKDKEAQAKAMDRKTWIEQARREFQDQTDSNA